MNMVNQEETTQLTLDWYSQLVIDCQQLINTAREQIVYKHWQMGKRILQDELKFQKPEYGSHFIENLAIDLGISQSTIKYELQFARKYPEFANALANLSWREAIKLLTSPAHVSHNSGDSEWYSPVEYLESARQVMGSIDVDPASSDKANELVKAGKYYTVENDGRDKDWCGNVWMNPPYSQPLIKTFSAALVNKYNQGEISQACVLVNNATETEHYQNMLNICKAVCFIKGRVKFIDTEGNASGAPLQGQTILYFGSNVEKFTRHFEQYGVILHANHK